jgi:hypothetical protein
MSRRAATRASCCREPRRSRPRLPVIFRPTRSLTSRPAEADNQGAAAQQVDQAIAGIKDNGSIRYPASKRKTLDLGPAPTMPRGEVPQAGGHGTLSRAGPWERQMPD